MEQLYQDHKDVAEFFMVYISEAHAIDDSWPMPLAKEKGIREHKTFGERCSVAKRLLSDKNLTIPCLADNIDNTVQDAYQAWPDRIFLVRTDGTLAVAGKRGPWGYEPSLRQATAWLAEFHETGKEPKLVKATEETPDFSALSTELGQAYQDGDYLKALKTFTKAGG